MVGGQTIRDIVTSPLPEVQTLTSQTLRVLYVDDDQQGCEMILEFFRHHNPSFEVTIVPNTHAAALSIALGKFDIYVIDNWLPGQTGVEFCHEIRLSDTSTPIIIYSAVAGQANIDEGLAAGANVYLIKPDDLMNLGPTIEQLILAKTAALHAT